MKVLLDESLSKRLAHVIEGHEVQTLPQMGWAGMKNGALMRSLWVGAMRL
jgi:hypothetical protein